MRSITIVEASRTRMMRDHPSAGLLLKELTRLEKFKTLSFIKISLMSLKSSQQMVCGVSSVQYCISEKEVRISLVWSKNVVEIN